MSIAGGRMLGELLVMGEPPAKLWKALAVLNLMHGGFDLRSRCIPHKSKESCVLCSLAVRDFLRAIGFDDAKALPVATVMRAEENGAELHSMGIGCREGAPPAKAGYWDGHMVATVGGFLIDTTLYSSRRPAWPELPGMVAAPIFPPSRQKLRGLDLLVGATLTDDERPSYVFDICWLENRSNRAWREGGDARDQTRRMPVVRYLIDRFGNWRD